MPTNPKPPAHALAGAAAAHETIVNNRQPPFGDAKRPSTTVTPSLGTFNPALPVDGSLIIAVELRDQFNGLLSLIQSIPAGPPGPEGPQGPPFAQAVIDGVTTLLPWEPAWVTVSFDGTDVHLSFGIPRGEAGTQGEQGQQGEPGPPFASAVVDGVTTLPPGSDATVSSWFDGTTVHLSFGIPEGEPGQQGPPGEVTAAQLDAAVATTARNPATVEPLNISISDPPSQGEVQQVLNRMNELITALKR